jgi:hypothetical protein
MSEVIPPRAELVAFVVLLQQYRITCARNSRANEPDRPYFGPDSTSSAAIVWRAVWQALDTVDFREPLGWPPAIFQVFEDLRFCPVHYYQGKEFTSALDRLDCQIKTLADACREAEGNLPENVDELPDLVSLDQAAAAVHTSKRTLERHKTEGNLPDPVREGGGGKPALYDWKIMRPWLIETFGIDLPERYPGNIK